MFIVFCLSVMFHFITKFLYFFYCLFNLCLFFLFLLYFLLIFFYYILMLFLYFLWHILLTFLLLLPNFNFWLLFFIYYNMIIMNDNTFRLSNFVCHSLLLLL